MICSIRAEGRRGYNAGKTNISHPVRKTSFYAGRDTGQSGVEQRSREVWCRSRGYDCGGCRRELVACWGGTGAGTVAAKVQETQPVEIRLDSPPPRCIAPLPPGTDSIVAT